MELEFDYVTIGAGSAGCVLANRLSDRRFRIQTPIGYGKTFCDESANWKYTTEPGPGINNRRRYRYDSRPTGASLFPVIQFR